MFIENLRPSINHLITNTSSPANTSQPYPTSTSLEYPPSASSQLTTPSSQQQAAERDTCLPLNILRESTETEFKRSKAKSQGKVDFETPSKSASKKTVFASPFTSSLASRLRVLEEQSKKLQFLHNQNKELRDDLSKSKICASKENVGKSSPVLQAKRHVFSALLTPNSQSNVFIPASMQSPKVADLERRLEGLLLDKENILSLGHV